MQGDYICIDIPGPGNIEAKGYDWVQCAPSIDPTQPGHTNIAHFYSEAATSTFMISGTEKCIYACIYGRNERPNFRNAGVAKIEWKALTEGMVYP